MPARPARVASTQRLSAAAAVLLLGAVVTGCGGGAGGAPGHAAGHPRSGEPARTSALVSGAGGCASVAAATLGGVAGRIYREASEGADAEQAIARVRGSAALASAISAGDSSATAKALRELLLDQIVGIQILQRGRVFASAGSGVAIAPVRGSIPGTNASFVLSVQSAASYLQVTRQVTGAEIVLLGASPQRVLAGTLPLAPRPDMPSSGTVAYRGESFETFSTTGSRYPAGGCESRCSCHTRRSDARSDSTGTSLDALGHVGERIYQEELGSDYVLGTLRHIEADDQLRRAVASAQPGGHARRSRRSVRGSHPCSARARVRTQAERRRAPVL